MGAWLVGAVMIAAQAIATLASWVLGRRQRAAASLPDAAGDVAPPSRPAASGTMPREAPVPERRRAAAEIREGFAWLFARRDLRGVLFVSTLVNLGFNAAMTTCLYSLQRDGVPPERISWLSAGVGAGLLIGALLAPRLVARFSTGGLTVAGLAALTAGVCLLPLWHDALPLAAVLGASMLATPALNAGLLGYFMVATPSELLGRAGSALNVFSTGAIPLAPLVAGLGLSCWGRTPTLLLCAGICAVSLAWGLTSRALRSLPAEDGWDEHALSHAAA